MMIFFFSFLLFLLRFNQKKLITDKNVTSKLNEQKEKRTKTFLTSNGNYGRMKSVSIEIPSGVNVLSKKIVFFSCKNSKNR